MPKPRVHLPGLEALPVPSTWKTFQICEVADPDSVAEWIQGPLRGVPLPSASPSLAGLCTCPRLDWTGDGVVLRNSQLKAPLRVQGASGRRGSLEAGRGTKTKKNSVECCRYQVCV